MVITSSVYCMHRTCPCHLCHPFVTYRLGHYIFQSLHIPIKEFLCFVRRSNRSSIIPRYCQKQGRTHFSWGRDTDVNRSQRSPTNHRASSFFDFCRNRFFRSRQDTVEVSTKNKNVTSRFSLFAIFYSTVCTLLPPYISAKPSHPTNGTKKPSPTPNNNTSSQRYNNRIP